MGSHNELIHKTTEKAIIIRVVAFFMSGKGVIDLQRQKETVGNAAGRKCTAKIPAIAGRVYTAGMMTLLMCQTAYAADIFSTAKSAMQKVYTDVAGLATVAAVVCAAVCLFLMNFSKSGKTVDESRAWLKRIIIC